MSVGKCKLCLINDATQTGSHVLSHFLIKGALNQAGRKDRDYELSFKFGSSPVKESAMYVGSKVLPEVIQEVVKKELTEEEKDELATYKDEVAPDYLFCPICEKRFGPVERYFEEHIATPLRLGKTTLVPDNEENHIFQNPKLDKGMIRLFVIMQFWRSSVAGYEGFAIKADFEEKLRRILNAALDVDLKITQTNAKRDTEILINYPMLLTFLQTKIETSDKFELTTNAIQLGKSKMPYFGLVNDFVMQLYEKESHLRSVPNHFYGLTDMIDKKVHLNHHEEVFRIGVLDDEKRKKITFGALYTVADLLRSDIKKMIEKFHNRVFGFPPSDNLVRGIFLTINATPDPSIRYSLDNILDKIQEAFIYIVSNGESFLITLTLIDKE